MRIKEAVAMALASREASLERVVAKVATKSTMTAFHKPNRPSKTGRS